MNHPSFEELVAYFAGDHDGEGALEEHLFSCDACTREASRVAAITETLRSDIPPVIESARLSLLRARGLRVVENEFLPGDHEIVFPRDVDVMVHRLGGLNLSAATSVGVRIFVESTDRTLVEIPAVKFDRDAGAVLIACQRHFAVMPPDVVMEVTVRGAAERVERYGIFHRFAR